MGFDPLGSRGRRIRGKMQAMARLGRLALFFSVSIAGSGCGGLVVFQEDGDDGAGGAGGTSNVSAGPGPINASSSGNTMSTTGTGTSGDCDALLSELETAIDHARACSPLDPVIQCDGSAILLDPCGCPSIVANEHNLAEIQAAADAFDKWVALGCGPFRCESCTPAQGEGFCQTRGDGSKGRCVPFLPD